MTPQYKCQWVASGTSANRGPFREEGSTSIRRNGSEIRDEESLREEIRRAVLDYLFEHKHTPWLPEPKYSEICNLKIELGEIVTLG